jgi:hypothetical protein
VERRLGSLAALELINVPLQGFVWFGVVGLPPTASNLLGFSLVTLLLLQGAAYWLAKRGQLRRQAQHLPAVAAFRIARLINPVLLGAGLAVTATAVFVAPGVATWPGLGFAAFAVLEYVNYYHVQLMHDTVADVRRLRSRGLRPSHLARDLRAVRPPRSAGVPD